MIPNNITSIENGTFWNCNSLTSITIPKGVTSIHQFAFDGSDRLAIINIQSTNPVSMFKRPPLSVFIVPDNSIDTYKAAWPDYANNIIGTCSMDEVSVTVSAKDNSSDLA